MASYRQLLLSLYVLFCLNCCAILVQASDSTQEVCTLHSLSMCMCRNYEHNLYIQCHNADLGKIPDDIPSNTANIYIDLDNITSLKEHSFFELTNLTLLEIREVKLTTIEIGAFNGLTSLRELDLTNNEISVIEKGVFDGLRHLVSLELDNNVIQHLPQGIFSDLERLQDLRLSGNKLSVVDSGVFDGLFSITSLMINDNTLEEVPNGALNSLPGHTLQTLRLNGNKITRLNGHDLNIIPLRNLSTLRLDNNRINTISEDAFTGLSLTLLNIAHNNLDHIAEQIFHDVFRSLSGEASSKLVITGNPLVCDCEMSGFIQWVNTTYVDVVGNCLTPTLLTDTSLQEVTSSDLRCHADLIQPTDDVIIDVGSNFTICCHSDRDDIHIMWFDPGTNDMSTDDECLHIEMKSKEDAGIYTCVALGTDLYDEAHITVSLPLKTTTSAPPLITTQFNEPDSSETSEAAVMVTVTYNVTTGNHLNTTNELNFAEKHSIGTVIVITCSFVFVVVVVIVILVIYFICRNRRKERNTAKGDVRSTSVTYSPMHGDVKIQAKPKSTNPKYEKLSTNRV
ncbi:uncharacterized protein LOC144436558 [Glandiceps talaboti]